MLWLDIAISGLVIGFASAAPIGPINILVISRSVRGRIGEGISISLVAALGDCTLALALGYGASILISLIEEYSRMVQVAGALIFLLFALSLLRSKPHFGQEKRNFLPTRFHHHGLLASVFIITVTNPGCLLLFIGAGAALPVNLALHKDLLALYSMTVFIGSAFWWLILNLSMYFIKDRVTGRHLLWVNRIAFLALMIFCIRMLFGPSYRF